MKKKKTRWIYPYDFERFRIHGTSYKSDAYYSLVADKMYQEVSKVIGEYDDEVADVCVRVSLYLEDVVSRIGLWHSFRQNHLKMYGKLMPCEIGMEDSIEEDFSQGSVQFVTWLEFSDVELTVRNPNSEFILKFSEIAYKVLQEEFKKAPVNVELRRNLFDSSIFGDFYAVRKNLYWLLDKSYLSSCRVVEEKIISICEEMVDA